MFGWAVCGWAPRAVVDPVREAEQRVAFLEGAEAREAADEAHALAAEAQRAAADREDAEGRARLEGVRVVGVGELAVLGVEDGGVVEGCAASRGNEQRCRAAVQCRGCEVRPAREDGVRGGGDE